MPHNIAISRFWMVTVNNPEEFVPTLAPGVIYVTGQKETASSGTVHWQLFYVLDRKQRSSWIHRNIHPGAACFGKRAEAIEDCIVYVTKDETLIADSRLELGIRPNQRDGQGRRTDLELARTAVLEGGASMQTLWLEHTSVMLRYSRGMSEFRSRALESLLPLEEFIPREGWQQRLVDVLSGPVDARKVIWRWSPEGSVGKSTFARSFMGRRGHTFSAGSYRDLAYEFSSVCHDVDVVFMDFGRVSAVDFPYDFAESLKNGVITNTKYESRTYRFACKHVVCFANYPPIQSRLSEDRWDIEEIQ